MSKAACLWLVISLVPLALSAEQTRSANEEYLEFNYGQITGGDQWVESIKVLEPPYRSDVQGSVTIKFEAPGMIVAKAMCWRQPTKENPSKWGHDVNLTPGGIDLGPDGRGSFVFPADQFPNGPTNIRILTNDGKGKRDICELQLFNNGGVKWNQGIPKADPPGAKGLQLIFSDDFDGPLSISNDGRGKRYNAHKPRFGDFSGWQFSDVLGDGKPFGQRGTWLQISARKDAESPKGRSGLIASVDMDGKGLWAKAPAYLECRFTAQSAPGTWPAFWTITHLDRNQSGDELDIVEAYGGVGKGHPNHPGYSIVSHFWGQKNADGTKKKGGQRATGNHDTRREIVLVDHVSHLRGADRPRGDCLLFRRHRGVAAPVQRRLAGQAALFPGELRDRRNQRLEDRSGTLRQRHGHVCGLHPGLCERAGEI